MLKGFEKQTDKLNEYEQYTLLPIMAKCLERHVGVEKAITNVEMCQKLKDKDYKIGEARVRKIINHIRNHDIVECLIASSKGYYVSEDINEIDDFIDSLDGRISAIQADKEAMVRQRNRLKERLAKKHDSRTNTNNEECHIA